MLSIEAFIFAQETQKFEKISVYQLYGMPLEYPIFSKTIVTLIGCSLTQKYYKNIFQGHEWTEQRRFALRRLRDFGLGKSSMEELIHEEIRQLFEQLDRQINQPLTMSLIFNVSVLNALWTLLTGSRLPLDDPKLQDMVQKVDALMKEFGNVTALTVFPVLRHIIPEWSGWNRMKKTFFHMKAFINNTIDQHKINYDEDIKENPRDFIDAFLNQIHDDANKGTSYHGNLGQQNLESVLLDLLFGGIETTSTALTWSILFMIKYPNVQRKVQDEIFGQVSFKSDTEIFLMITGP